MFSIVTENMKTLTSYNVANPQDLQNDMRDIIAEVIQRTSYDIYLFYGENAYQHVNQNMSNALSYAYNQGRNIYISEFNGKFVHVSSKTCGGRTKANFVAYNSTYSKVF